MKNLILLFLTATLFSTAQSQVVLYEQGSDNNKTNALPSNYVLSPPFGIYLAEDFTLTEANNTLTEITFFGYQKDEILPTIIQGLHLYIYKNLEGQNIPDGNPENNGTGIYEFLSLGQGSDFTITNPGGNDLYNLTVNLIAANNGQGVTLAEGVYWVCVVPEIPFSGVSITNPEPVWFWNWFRGQESTNGNPGQILDPTNFLEQGFSSWTNIENAGSSGKSTLAMVIEGDNGTLSISSSVKELITVHPNPSTEYVNIHLPKGVEIVSADIFDMYGKQQLSEKNNTVLNVESLATGIYFLRIETNAGTMTRKLLKK